MNIFTISLGIFYLSAAPVSAARCAREDEALGRSLEHCMHVGAHFLVLYTKSLRSKKVQKFDTCRSFQSFEDCLSAVSRNCSAAERLIPADWLKLTQHFRCACSGDHECKKVSSCLQAHYSDVLSRRCDSVYKMNVQQRTRNKCTFVEERVRCHHAIISSACGQEAGDVSFSLLRLLASRARRSCKVTLSEFYGGFRFDERCPSTLSARIHQCKLQFLASSRRATFAQVNDLIASSQVAELTSACQKLELFEECTSEVEQDCPDGLALLYDADSRLRTYLLKMRYICRIAHPEYSDHLACYQQVLENNTLDECKVIWESLLPMISNISAVQFYCLPQSAASQSFNQVLRSLRNCYVGVFSRSCGLSASDSIAGLMDRAFKDPLYLRMKHRPNCTLHRSHSIRHGHNLQRAHTMPRKGTREAVISNHSVTSATKVFSSSQSLPSVNVYLLLPIALLEIFFLKVS